MRIVDVERLIEIAGELFSAIERQIHRIEEELTFAGGEGSTLYKAIVDDLKAEIGLRPEDVLINLVEVKKENWSFGNGVAQYAA